jgi:hypothetical protein
MAGWEPMTKKGGAGVRPPPALVKRPGLPPLVLLDPCIHVSDVEEDAPPLLNVRDTSSPLKVSEGGRSPPQVFSRLADRVEPLPKGRKGRP